MGALGSDITTARGFTVSDGGLDEHKGLNGLVDTYTCVTHTMVDKLTDFLARATEMFTYTPNLFCSPPRHHFCAA